MLSEVEIVINRFAQDKSTLNEVLDWFIKFDYDHQTKILENVRLFLEQSHPDQAFVDDSLKQIPLKPTITAIVLFKKHPYKVAAASVCNLPAYELKNSFITLLTLFKYSDSRRRELFCKGHCTHEWHNFDKQANNGQNRLLKRLKKLFTN